MEEFRFGYPEIRMKRIITAATLLMATAQAFAQGIPQMMMGTDPLSVQVRMKATNEPNFGIQGVVGVGEKNTPVKLVLAEPVNDPAKPLKVAAALKPAKRKAPIDKRAQRALRQLRLVRDKKQSI